MNNSLFGKIVSFFRERKFLSFILIILAAGYLLPENYVFPVKNGGKKDFKQNSFWYYPWGRSGTHKGVDIFAGKGTAVQAATGGIVVYAGQIAVGGNVVFVLGPKWRLHYYAHLNSINTSLFSFVGSGEVIGEVGNSGNAAGKAPHLHYSINSLIPAPWKIDGDHQGWKKMFYVNPIPLLNAVAK
jgi:peptidoglycan LD-endopeptidase LytH